MSGSGDRPAEAPTRTRIRSLAATIRARVRRRRRLSSRWLTRARLDLADRLAGRHDPMVPPRRLGLSSQVRGVGERIVRLGLVGAGDLQPDDRVLDIGCGAGRQAVPLTQVLGPDGSYEGFDVAGPAIEWAQRKITPRDARFRFRRVDVGNAMYNPGGGEAGSAFEFPYPDAEFDLAFAVSVFTHLRPATIARYLTESARVLRPGGRLVATYHLLDEATERQIAGGLEQREWLLGGPVSLDHADADEVGRFRSSRADRPEDLIAVYRDEVLGWHADAGLEVREVRLGHWRGGERTPEMLGQDLVVAVRT